MKHCDHPRWMDRKQPDSPESLRPGERHWQAGDVVERDGFAFRVRRGKYGDDDLVLMVRSDGWVPMPMSALAIAFAFLAKNENAIAKSYWMECGHEHLGELLRQSYLRGWRLPVRAMVEAPKARLREALVLDLDEGSD